MAPSPRLSVIIPVHGDPALLTLCLESLRASTFTSFEIIVSDDGSPVPAAIRAAAEACQARYLRSATRQGSAAARNRAADLATGEILVFIDSDVTVRPSTLGQLAAALENDPQLDAVIGSYDTDPSAPNLVSQFRNLMHSQAHQASNPNAHTFWTGCGAIRRSRFRALEGFKENFRRPSIEDVELGFRLYESGGHILLDRSIQVTHHKRWTLASMVETDLFARAIPWAATIGEHGLPQDLNFRWSARIGASSPACSSPSASSRCATTPPGGSSSPSLWQASRAATPRCCASSPAPADPSSPCAASPCYCSSTSPASPDSSPACCSPKAAATAGSGPPSPPASG